MILSSTEFLLQRLNPVLRGSLSDLMSYLTRQDTDNAFFRYPQPKIRIQECPDDVEEEKERAGDETPCLQSEVLVPERDAEPSCSAERDCSETSVPSGGDTEREGEATEGVLQMSDSILQHGERCIANLHSKLVHEQVYYR